MNKFCKTARLVKFRDLYKAFRDLPSKFISLQEIFRIYFREIPGDDEITDLLYIAILKSCLWITENIVSYSAETDWNWHFILDRNRVYAAVREIADCTDNIPIDVTITRGNIDKTETCRIYIDDTLKDIQLKNYTDTEILNILINSAGLQKPMRFAKTVNTNVRYENTPQTDTMYGNVMSDDTFTKLKKLQKEIEGGSIPHYYNPPTPYPPYSLPGPIYNPGIPMPTPDPSVYPMFNSGAQYQPYHYTPINTPYQYLNTDQFIPIKDLGEFAKKYRCYLPDPSINIPFPIGTYKLEPGKIESYPGFSVIFRSNYERRNRNG